MQQMTIMLTTYCLTSTFIVAHVIANELLDFANIQLSQEVTDDDNYSLRSQIGPERSSRENDFNNESSKRGHPEERKSREDKDAADEALFTSLFSNLRGGSSKNVKSDSDEKFASSDPVEREFLDFINSLDRENKTINRKSATMETESQDAAWTRMMEGELSTRPRFNEEDVSSTLIQSSSESMAPMYSNLPYSIPIPIMMQMPMGAMMGMDGKKSSDGGKCLKMVDTCKEGDKEGNYQTSNEMQMAKYSNEATGGSRRKSDSNSYQPAGSECGEKKNLTSVVNKMEEVMKKTMKSYVDNMMSGKIEKAMKSAMHKMKSSTGSSYKSPSKSNSRPVYPASDKIDMTVDNAPPQMTVETNYMTDIMLGMMNLDKSSGSKCPCSASKQPAPPKKETSNYKDEKDEKDESDDANSYEESKVDDDIDEGALLNQVKEAMSEVMMDAMKETMNQVMLESYPN